MPKDRNDHFHPKKGKPSGPGHEKAGLKDLTDKNYSEQAMQIAEKYVNEAEEPDENLWERHKNRNVNKPDIDKPAYS